MTDPRRNISSGGPWEAVGRAHGEAFGSIRPAATMVEVGRLIDADMPVEIEVAAFIHAPPHGGGAEGQPGQ